MVSYTSMTSSGFLRTMRPPGSSSVVTKSVSSIIKLNFFPQCTEVLENLKISEKRSHANGTTDDQN